MMNQSKFSVRHGVLRWLLLIVLVLMSAVALNMQPVIVKGGNIFKIFRDMLGTVQLAHSVAAVALAFFYERTLLRDDAPFSLSALFAGALFAALLITGMSFARFHDFSFIIASSKQYFPALVTFCGYWTILYSGLKALFNRLDNITISERKYDGVLGWIDRHLFLFAFLVMFLCWGIGWAVFFPATVSPDAQAQLNQYSGIVAFSRHHPYFCTLFMGTLYKIGVVLINERFAIALNVLFQIFLNAASFSSVCAYLRKKGMSLAFVLTCVAFFALVPIWASYMQWIVKDTYYLGFFTLFVLEYIKYFLEDGGKSTLLRLITAGTFVCLLRSEGFYIALLSLIVMLILKHKQWKGICVASLVIIFWGAIINIAWLNYRDIPEDNYKESMSIPFSQVARSALKHGDELTAQERATIDAVLPYDKLAENYNPVHSDSLKNNYRRSCTPQERTAFSNLWVKLASRYPLDYVEAVMNHMYGYFYPFHSTADAIIFRSFTKRVQPLDYPHYSVFVNSEKIRSVVIDSANLWRKIPVLSLFITSAFYTWILLFAAAALLRRKDWRTTFVLAPLGFIVLVCFLSPVNGSMRYILPVVSCAPLVLFLVFYRYGCPQENAPLANEHDKAVNLLCAFATAILIFFVLEPLPELKAVTPGTLKIARLDIKLNGEDAQLELLEKSDADAREQEPGWLQKGGKGYIVESIAGQIKLIFKADTDGKLNINLRGRDVRDRKDRKKRIPVWIDYTSFKFNGKEELAEITSVWHDKPKNLSYQVKKGDTITIEAAWQQHK